MDYRPLGRTGVKVSPLCLGSSNFGRVGKTSLDDTCAIIDAALDRGINFIDTANVYSRGRSEECVGEALRRNGPRGRGRVVLATKVSSRMEDTDPNMEGINRRHILQQCEASLKRLQTDWIDLYQLHRPDPGIPIDETLRALDDLIRQGKVRYIGGSCYAAWEHMEALWVAKELGLNRFVSEQAPYHLLDRSIEREVIPMAQTYGLAIMAFSPLAGGFLTGRYKRGEEVPAGTRLANNARGREDAYYSDASYRVVERVEEIARDKGCTASHLALAWNLSQPGVTSPIIGPRTMEQLLDNLGALAVTVTDEDRRRLDEVTPPGGRIVPIHPDSAVHTQRW